MSDTRTTRIIVNASFYETRVAVLKGEQLLEIEIERAKEKYYTGNIYRGRIVRLLPGMQSAFVDINEARTAFLHISDVAERWNRARSQRPLRLEELYREGERILSQIIRDPVKDKGAKLSTKLTYTGRFAVVVVGAPVTGISRKILDRKARRRLHELISKLQRRGTGLIFRTAAEWADTEWIVREVDQLYATAERIATSYQEKNSPELLWAEPPLAIRAARDILNGRDEEIVVDDEETHKQLEAYLKEVDPGALPSLKHYTGSQHLFDYYGVEDQIHRALQSEIQLPSGGSIVIEETEALTAIDVNTGHYTGRANAEQTLLKTNLEAADHIADQIKLRNIGGLIMIDFIDMARPENERKVSHALMEAFKYEKGRTIIQRFSGLGVIEMARFQTRRSLRGMLTERCSTCNATGQVKKPITISFEILRSLERKLRENSRPSIAVTAHPDIAYRMESEDRTYLDRLKESFRVSIDVKSDARFRLDEFWID